VDLIRSNDPRYDDARAVFNAMIDKRARGYRPVRHT
jgi:hypothetical protein